ncbi:MAG: CHAT domain-containing protein [Candidatus Delongbacteria bacterium]
MKRGLVILILTVSALLLSFDIRDYEPKQITTESSSETNVVVRDNNTVYFASDRSGNYDIYKKNIEDETVIRLTSHPGNEYPVSYNKNIIMLSDETDIYKNPYFLNEKGKKEIIYSSVGREMHPLYRNGKLYFSKTAREGPKFVRYDTRKKKTEQLKGASGTDMMFFSDNKVMFCSREDDEGYNNLFSAVIRNDSIVDVESMTYGKRIITGYDISQDKEIVVFSAVSSDTNKDLRIDLFDNSVLYRIDTAGKFWTDPVQLTSDSYSSTDPCIAPDGTIFFVSDKKGDPDIFSCKMEGVAPLKDSFAEQKKVSDQIYERYRAQRALSEATDKNISDDSSELLSTALISYYRALSYYGTAEKEMAEIYFRIAEIYETVKDISSAESIYRIIVAKYSHIENLSGRAEIKRLSLELKRRRISDSEYSYELDQHLDYLVRLGKEYKNKEIKNLINMRIGQIHFNLNNYTTANSYFIAGQKKSDGTENPEAYFRMARTAFANENYSAGSELLQKAIASAEDPDQKGKYIVSYLDVLSRENDTGSAGITNILSDNNAAAELKSYAAMTMGESSDDIDIMAEYFGNVKQYYVSEPDNYLLKKFSARSDLMLAETYIQHDMTEEAEGTLKYIIDNYTGFDYDIYPSVASVKLSDIYLGKASGFIEREMYDNALLFYFKAYELDDSNIIVIRGIVESYLGLNRIDEAVRYFEKQHGSDTNNAQLNYAMGYCYAVRGTQGIPVRSDLLRAVKFLERSLEIDGEIIYSYLTLSYCHEGLYHISLKEKIRKKDKNLFLKAFDYVTGPLKFILETVKLIEDTDFDHNDEAITLLNRGLSLTEYSADKKLYLKLKLNLANNYYNMGEYAREQALINYLFIIDKGYEFSSQEQKAIVYERIGHCLFTIKDQSAEKYYRTALELYKGLNRRESEIRVFMRLALLYLANEDEEGEYIGGFDAYEKYSELLVKLQSENRTDAVKLVKRNSAFAKFLDQEYEYSSLILNELISEYKEYEGYLDSDDYIILTLLGLNIPVWKFDLTIGSQYSEGFKGKEELALLYSLNSSNYQNLKEFGEVEKELLKKAELFKKNNLVLSLIENRLGIIYYSVSKMEKSIKKFSSSRSICNKLNFYRAALINENNILKARLNRIDIRDEPAIEKLISDTTTFSNAYTLSQMPEKSENLNLKGMLSYKLYSTLNSSDKPEARYRALQYLIRAEDLFKKAYNEAGRSLREGETVNRFSAAALFNLSEVFLESGYYQKAHETLKKGRKKAASTTDKLLNWRYLLKLGDHERSPEKKLDLYSRAEKILSQYLPSTEGYELVTGWTEDIDPLYDRLVEGCLRSQKFKEAMNYAERSKNRKLLNYYSSRYLDYREQLHNIHIRKIRYNNDEIIKYRQKAEILRRKDADKYSDRIEEYEEKADIYNSELKEIYEQIRKSNDERLLQFVSIEDINYPQVKEILDRDQAVISIYSSKDSTIFFYFDHKGIQYQKSGREKHLKIPESFTSGNDLPEQIFVIPDIDKSYDMDFFARSNYQNGLNITILPSVLSLKTVNENKNINYTELKKCSSISSSSAPLSSEFESGGIVYFDKPVKIDRINSLESEFSFKDKKVPLKEFLKFKMPAYAVILKGFEGNTRPMDKALLLNTMIFAGASTVVFPADPDQYTGKQIDDIVKKIHDDAPEQNISDILSDVNIPMSVSGLAGMNKKEQNDFAERNLRSSLVNGIRYYNSKVYEKASVFFLEALAMARNINDPQELNILKTLISSFSRMRDYKRAVIYGKQLLEYTESKNMDKERIKAYDSLSKDYFRYEKYNESIECQLKILDDPHTNKNAKLASYNMLSTIYSRTGDEKKSIYYKKRFLKDAGLTGEEFTDLNRNVKGNAAKVLFNSMRNIMVNYYRQGKIDSALFVYRTISENEGLFDEIEKNDLGELYESAGLCYFRRSNYSGAEEMYKRSLELAGDRNRMISVYLNLADVYYFTNKLLQSEKYLSLAKNSDPGDSEQIRLYNTWSLIEVRKNDIATAVSYSYRALEKTLEIGNEFEESTARVNLAKILILENNIESAKRNLEQSLILAKKTKNVKAELSSMFYKGEIFLDADNEPDSALVYYERCLDLSILENDEYFRARSLYGTGRTYYRKDDPEKAVSYFKKAMQRSIEPGFDDIYINSAYMLSEIYKITDAKKELDILNDLIVRAVELSAESESVFLSNIEQQVWDGFDKIINIHITETRYEDALSYIVLKDDLITFEDMKYFDLKDKKTSPVKQQKFSISEIREWISKKEALLMFLPAGKVCNILLIDSRGVTNFSAELNKDITDLSARIAAKGDHSGAAQRSYDILFPDGLRDILTDKERLYMYSSNILKNYPFDVLFDGKKYLIDRYDIAEVGDMGEFKAGNRNDNIKKSISFVDPFTAESDLVFAKREYNSLKYFGNSTFSAEKREATETLLKSEEATQYDMIHLPVHSFILSKDSLKRTGRSSYVQLSADGSNDGRLEWDEILKLDTKGTDVILSGCNTGGGSAKEYYRHFDLSKAFLLSGSNTVISSKWKTDDLSASVLMKRYFRYLFSGHGRIEALSKAKRDVKLYLDLHPYYWANFKINLNYSD